MFGYGTGMLYLYLCGISGLYELVMRTGKGRKVPKSSTFALSQRLSRLEARKNARKILSCRLTIMLLD